MKKSVVTLLFVFATTLMFGQIEISPTFGYTFTGKANVKGGYLDVKNDMAYGGILSIGMGPSSYLELSYNRSDTKVVEEGFISERGEFNTGIEHYQLGFLREFPTQNDQVVPFANFTLGASRYFGKRNYSYDSTFFSGSIGGGVKVFFAENIGFRFHTTLVMPSVFDGGGIYCDPYYGCTTGGSYRIPFVHWNFSLGLIFRTGS